MKDLLGIKSSIFLLKQTQIYSWSRKKNLDRPQKHVKEMSQIQKAEALFYCWPSIFSWPPERWGNSGSRQVFGDLSRIKPLLNTLRRCTITFCQNAWINSPWNAHNGILRHLDKWMGSLPVEEQEREGASVVMVTVNAFLSTLDSG